MVIVVTVYIPLSAVAEVACGVVPLKFLNKHLNSFVIITEDLTHVSVSSILPTFYQFIGCTTRENKTLDLFICKCKECLQCYYLAHSHLDGAGGIVQIMFFDFSIAFNTIQPLPLRDKLLTTWVDRATIS